MILQNNYREMMASPLLMIAGALALVETMLGCVYVMGVGFSTWHDIFTDVCLTMAFPIYLVALISLRGAAFALWLFFLTQWIDVCSNKVPPGFVNPFGWVHGVFLFITAVMVTLSAVRSRKNNNSE